MSPMFLEGTSNIQPCPMCLGHRRLEAEDNVLKGSNASTVPSCHLGNKKNDAGQWNMASKIVSMKFQCGGTLIVQQMWTSNLHVVASTLIWWWSNNEGSFWKLYATCKPRTLHGRVATCKQQEHRGIKEMYHMDVVVYSLNWTPVWGSVSITTWLLFYLQYLRQAAPRGRWVPQVAGLRSWGTIVQYECSVLLLVLYTSFMQAYWSTCTLYQVLLLECFTACSGVLRSTSE